MSIRGKSEVNSLFEDVKQLLIIWVILTLSLCTCLLRQKHTLATGVNLICDCSWSYPEHMEGAGRGKLIHTVPLQLYDLGGMGVLISSLTWMQHGHRVNTPSSSPPPPPPVPCKLMEVVTLVHPRTCTQTSSGACTEPRAFVIITMLSARGKVGLCGAAAERQLSVWGGLSLTLGLKHQSLLKRSLSDFWLRQ